ncbi:MAG: septum formation initiator family protein [Gammaproteobacteria bacterium]
MIILFISLQIRFWVGDGGVVELLRLKNEMTAEDIALARLKDRNQVLEAEVQDLKHHLSALEERARNELGMVRRGETLYQTSQ